MNATSALGWALLHFLWQGTLIALVARLLLAALPARLAAARYAVGVAALAAMPVAVLASAARGLGQPSPIDVMAPAAVEPSPGPSARPVEDESRAAAETEKLSDAATGANASLTVSAAQPSGSWRQRVDGALPWVVGAWAIGALALSLRLLSGYFATRRLVRGRGEPAPATVSSLVERLSVRLRVHRTVRVCCTSLTQVPAVAGWLSPVLLLPASALTGLAPAQLEAILAHELAHVRRHDYLVNVLQSLIETLLFYHPAVWWLGARVREEREHCCDDLAVAACGSAPRYAEALLSMERLRGAPELAVALTGGSLLARVERLLAPRSRSLETFPRWMAGASAAAIVLVFVATSDLAGAAAQGRERAGKDERRAALEEPTGPGDVLLHPDPAQPFERRNEWALAEASRRGYREFWLGHAIAPAPSLADGILMARFEREEGLIIGEGDDQITVSGRIVSILTHDHTNDLHLPGEPLAPLVGADPADVGILYLCSARGSRTSVQRVHLATTRLNVDFHGLPLLWLGRTDDRESVRDALAKMEQAESSDLRGEMVGVIGAHGTSALVVPELTRILGSASLPEDMRSDAAEWLANHPVMEALTALDRAARHDRSEDVRREAAEAVGEMKFAPAFDVLVALARELEDPEARREAVEGFGERTEPAAVPALEEIANSDRDEDIQREAVETLGELPAGAGLAAVSAIAHGHPNQEVRCEAVETYGECATPDQALSFLQELVARDPAPDVRREAVETLGETISPGEALPVLERIAFHHSLVDVRREACETLAELHDERVVEILTRIAIEADDEEVQREAVESLGETILGDAVAPVLEGLARRHPSLEIQREAVETLGDLHDEENHVLDIVATLAADHPSAQIRVEAVETLADHWPEDSAAALFQRLLGAERSPRVREALKDALESAGKTDAEKDDEK